MSRVQRHTLLLVIFKKTFLKKVIVDINVRNPLDDKRRRGQSHDERGYNEKKIMFFFSKLR